jgi:hypothetical protein
MQIPSDSHFPEQYDSPLAHAKADDLRLSG